MTHMKKLVVLAVLLVVPALASACADVTGPRPSLDTTCETQGPVNRCH